MNVPTAARRLAAITFAAAAGLAVFPATAGAQDFPAPISTIPVGCRPIVSFYNPTVDIPGDSCTTPLPVTVIADEHGAPDADRLRVVNVMIMDGDPLPVPALDGCSIVQFDLFQGTWTPDMLRALEADGRSPGPWLYTAALVVPDGFEVPAAWASFPNAVIHVEAGDCAEPEPTTTTTAPTATTTTEQPTPTTVTTTDAPLDTTTTTPAITEISRVTPFTPNTNGNIAGPRLPETGSEVSKRAFAGSTVASIGAALMIGAKAWERRRRMLKGAD